MKKAVKTILLSALAGAVLSYLIVNGVRRILVHHSCSQALPAGGEGPASMGGGLASGMRFSRELRPVVKPSNSRG